MPTYEFRCTNGHDFEQFHRKISDAPTSVPCPSCGATAERRISGGAGLQFKGSGFYLTDYGKNAHRSSGPAKSGESGGGEGKSGGSASTKSDGGSSGGSGRSSGASSGASSSGSGGKSDAGGSSKGAA